MNKLIFLNTGGFHLITLNYDSELVDFKKYLSRSIINWRYIFIPRKIVTFPVIFKYIVENQSLGKQYIKIYFYEQRDNPIELITYLKNKQSLFILNSNIPMYKIVKRIIANPRFSETIIFTAELENDVHNQLNKYERFTKLLNKLYPEVSKIAYSRGVGKVMAIELSEENGLINLSICVSQKSVLYEINIESINIDIKGLDQCFPQ